MDPQIATGVIIVMAVAGVGAVAAMFASKVLSSRLGWDNLAEKYPVKAEFLGDWKVKQSLYIKDIFFPDCIDVAADDNGLYFAFRFPLQSFKRVQIPWDATQDAMVRGKTIEMSIEGVKLRIRQSSFNQIALGHLIKE